MLSPEAREQSIHEQYVFVSIPVDSPQWHGYLAIEVQNTFWLSSAWRAVSDAGLIGTLFDGRGSVIISNQHGSHALDMSQSEIRDANYAGKLDVGAAIGYGTLTVIKDMGLKEPYSSQVPLGTSEVAEDLTYYFATSEQVPSAVALGVLMEKNNTVKQAGGFIVQLMPFAEEEVISALEEKIAKITSVTDMLEKGMTPEDILEFVLGDLGVEITDKVPTKFYCNCSKERVTKALMGINKAEIKDMINEGKDIEVNCHFCNTNYNFSVEELKKLL